MGDAPTHEMAKLLYDRYGITPQQSTRLRVDGFVIFHPDDIPGNGPLAYNETEGRMVRLEQFEAKPRPVTPDDWLWRFPAALEAKQ